MERGPTVKQQPPGFSINYDRYQGSWRWRQKIGADAAKKAGHVVQRAGFRNRNGALQDLLAELECRSTRAAPDAATSDGQAAAR